MKITVKTQMPAAKPGQLTALIDLGKDRALFVRETARQHPAWADLERQRAKQSAKKASAYLALGAAPLLYLPAREARFWDDDEKIRILAARALDAAVERRAAELVIPLDGPAGATAAPLAAEGLALRAYRFNKYKSEDGPPRKDPAVTLVVAPSQAVAVRRQVERALARVDSVNHARDLINEPGSVVTPAVVEARAREVAQAEGLKIKVLDAKQLEEQGYQGLLTVGRGGNVPPRMIVLSYEPQTRASLAPGAAPTHLGLLGKGVTFDTGGISIKPASKMWEMKGDMSGAAAVLFAMETIAREAPPVRVTAVIVTAQNYVDNTSTLPGDIFRARNGKTVHVDNTDAEGRLILSDGLWRMGEEKVTHLVDIATLTGACVRALGTSISGVFGNDAFADEIAQVAAAQGEPCWRLPLVEEYMEWLKSDVADINNISEGGLAGATTAALFLREFVPEGVHWAHLDIAGTFLAEKSWKYYRPGATGVMVRSMVALAEHLAGEK